MFATIFEVEAGTGDEHRDRWRDQDLTRTCGRHDSGGNMNADASDTAVKDLHLAGVNSGSNRDPKRAQGVGERPGAADRPTRTVEGRKNAVTHSAAGVNEATSVLLDDGPGQYVVALEKIAPFPVAHGGRLFG